MAIKIRMRQQGRKNKRMYRLVVADSRSPRDGKYLESLGWYNPHAEKLEQKVAVHEDKINEWLGKGAQMTEKARALLSKIAPATIKALREKELERKNKRAAKRRASRKKRAEKKGTVKKAPANKAAAKAPAKPKTEKAPAKKAAPKTEAKKAAPKKDEASE
jgi:small subunit ribosomal protein S16